MKAEHRKELQTNALADRMGRFINRIKQRPSRGAFLWWVLIIAVVLAAGFFLLRRGAARNRDARLWERFARGNYPVSEQEDNYAQLRREPGLQGRAASLQLAWYALHELGIKRLLADPQTAMQYIDVAKKLYEETLPDVKNDSVLAPEVKYALAVAEEALAADPVHSDLKAQLDKAADLYRAVADEYPDSAHGKQAKKRHERFSTPSQRAEIHWFYQQLRDPWNRLPLDHPLRHQLEGILKKG
jgi:hypothetical protein